MERIDNLLTKKGFFPSRQKAQYEIEAGHVFVNGNQIQKASKQVQEDADIEIKGQTLKYVSKGGLKLEKAIEVFGLSLADKTCMDIGASTGGFTDCMLQNGAEKVYAIDVGHGQLDEKLIKEDRVENLEGMNIKEAEKSQFPDIDFICMDVSFISILQILPKAYELLNTTGSLIGLIKPQFEVGKSNLNKQGVVKDKKLHEKCIQNVIQLADQLGFKLSRIGVFTY